MFVVKKLFVVFSFLFLAGQLSAQEVHLKEGKYYDTDDLPYTGVFKEYGPKQVILSESSIKQGLLDGQSIFYYNSGAKKEQREYREGKKDGLWINWSESGLKTAEARFINGKKDGFWYIWDEKGTKRYEMFYQKGEKKGTWYIWDEDGKLITEQKYD